MSAYKNADTFSQAAAVLTAWITPPHCRHCPRYQKEAAAIEDGYDYSHLIGDPPTHRDKVADVTRFDQWLTDYGRILLKFGMHILWQ